MEKKIKQLENLKCDFYGLFDETKESQFFKSSILNMCISFEIGIGHYNEKNISFESICKNIPKKIGSRSSIQNILNEAVRLKYFLKKESQIDKRIKLYTFSIKYCDMINLWIHNHEANFQSDMF